MPAALELARGDVADVPGGPTVADMIIGNLRRISPLFPPHGAVLLTGGPAPRPSEPTPPAVPAAQPGCSTGVMDFTSMPERLDTERLTLTPETLDDAPWLAELFTTRGAGPVSVAEAAARVTAMQAVVAELGIDARVLRAKADGVPLGYCAIIVGRGTLAEPELAYELLPAARGHGYATEGARAVLAAAFGTGRSRIWATVGSWNTPSLRVLARLGFRRDHTTAGEHGEILWLVRDADTPRRQAGGVETAESAPSTRAGSSSSAAARAHDQPARK